jgi:glycosyltransferase involved in cell wall biosynthesis
MIGPVPLHWGGGGRWRGGGVATHVAGIVPALTGCGVSVELLAENATTLAKAAAPSSARVVPVTHSWPRLLARGGVALPRMVSRLLAPPWKTQRIPIGQSLRYLGLAANYRAFLKTVQPPLLHIHNARHAQFLCQRVVSTDLPTVVTVHGVKSLVLPSPQWLRSMVLYNYRHADRLIAVSSFVRENLLRYGAPADRVTVIPNAVDSEKFSPADPEHARHQLELPNRGLVVLFTGNLVTLKGVDHLLEAFSRSAAREHGTLVIVGDGPEKASLVRMARELGVADATRFVGARPLPEMPLWYQACDVFVMPSSVEGLSMSVLEAMSSARPVITTPQEVGKHDGVSDGSTGALVAFGDVDGLGAAIDRVLRDRDGSRRMGHLARKLVMERYTWPQVAERTAEVYRETVLEYRSRHSDGRRDDASDAR